jgi:hypothetical protein
MNLIRAGFLDLRRASGHRVDVLNCPTTGTADHERKLRRSPTGDGKHLPPQHLRMPLGGKATSRHDINRLGVAGTGDESVYRPVATSRTACTGQCLKSSLPR